MSLRSIPEQIHDLPGNWRERPLYSSSAGRLTYGEVRAAMLHAAGWLSTRHGVAAGDRVALCMPKSLEAVALLYGVLAAGAAFVTLQYQGPPERLRGVLASTRPRLLLTTPEMARHLAPAPGPAVATLVPDAAGRGLDATLAEVAPLAQPAPVTLDDLAAIYHTSGSTGKPKGIMWSHRTLAAGTASLPIWAGMTPADRLISVSALNYTASAEMFYPVAVGASTHLLSEREALVPELISARMEREGTTLWTATATALRLLVENGRLEARNLTALRHVNFFGERVPPAILREAMRLIPSAAFFNFYGASEAFTIMTYRLPRPLPDDLTVLPLGRPTGAHTQSLRDEDGREVAPGAIGEVCLVGPAVMAGYWDAPELTAARRLPGIPLSFRTGDLAWCDVDGTHFLAGRRDQLVKLRGHRFDLGEIEAALKAHPEVRDAVAFRIETEGGQAQAVILATPREGLLGAIAELCRRRLPIFAQPARLFVADTFPRLPGGKIDRRSVTAAFGPKSETDPARSAQ